ncbi:MAG TPA: GAF domain-containing sensor histidine kinase [Anaerolineae bacterium]|nr:GAF domain-containing sensor histidine kinase [Anaerolineae bacterium]
MNNQSKEIEQYRKLIEISRDLASTLDLNILLNKIVHAASDICESEAASILLYDAAKNVLFFQEATNIEKPLMKGLVVPVSDSIAGWIVQNQEPIIVNDTSKESRHFSKIGQQTQFKTKSLLGAPLISKTRVVGVLEAINKKFGKFTKNDTDVLMTLSAQAAVAIETSWLFQQSDLISEFVHELRTPLASINTAAYLLTRTSIPKDQQDQMVGIVYSETKRLSQMATDFLDLARMESGRIQFAKQRFPLNDLTEECIELVRSQAQDKKINLTMSTSADDLIIEGDRDKIKQVILNLLSNALKYNQPGGKILVQTKSKGNFAELSITDTGPGIPQEHLNYIFNKFFRVPGLEEYAQGTGLGLSIAKHIIESHGGIIEVESKVNHGSTFTVTIPKV